MYNKDALPCYADSDTNCVDCGYFNPDCIGGCECGYRRVYPFRDPMTGAANSCEVICTED